MAPELLDRHAELYEDLSSSYPWDASENVASHNDLNPRNILFDGVRLWLIDWETAYRNDRFVDLAILTAETVCTPASEQIMLEAWLARSPSPIEKDRMAVMKPIARLYHACLLLAPLVSGSSETIETLAAPTHDDFVLAVAQGRLQLGAPDLSIAFAKMLLAGFLGLATALETRSACDRLSR
jgi:hypothetical protein